MPAPVLEAQRHSKQSSGSDLRCLQASGLELGRIRPQRSLDLDWAGMAHSYLAYSSIPSLPRRTLQGLFGYLVGQGMIPSSAPA